MGKKELDFDYFNDYEVEVQDITMKTDEQNNTIIDRLILTTDKGVIEHVPNITEKVPPTKESPMPQLRKRKARIDEIPPVMTKIYDTIQSNGSCVITCNCFDRIEGDQKKRYIKTEELPNIKIQSKAKKQKKSKDDEEVFSLDDIEANEDLEKV